MEHKVVKKTEVKVEEAKSKKDRELQEPKMSSDAFRAIPGWKLRYMKIHV